jgi:hypothetical protein
VLNVSPSKSKQWDLFCWKQGGQLFLPFLQPQGDAMVDLLMPLWGGNETVPLSGFRPEG